MTIIFSILVFVVISFSSIWDVLKDAAHNRNLYRTGRANKSEVRYSASWRPDPWNHDDGFTLNESGEYSCIIRKKPSGKEKREERVTEHSLRKQYAEEAKQAGGKIAPFWQWLKAQH